MWELVHIPPTAPLMKEFQEHPHAKSWMRLIGQFIQRSQTQETLCTLCDNRLGWDGIFNFDVLILYQSMLADKNNCIVMGICAACLKAYDDVDERCVEKLRKGVVGFSELENLPVFIEEEFEAMASAQEEAQKAQIEESRVDRIRRILALYGIDHDTACWSVHGKPVIYHVALERIATKAGITFELPTIVRAEKDEAVLIVGGRMGSKLEWATGEAAVGVNYKVKGAQAPYVYAMAEKRGKDRVILKLIELHGDLYSEDEADDLKQQFDAEIASKAIIAEIDRQTTHTGIESLMKSKSVIDDLAKMSQPMADHVRTYAKDTFRYLRSRAGVHGGNGRAQGSRQEAAGGGFARSGGGQRGEGFAGQGASQDRQATSQARTERDEWATQTRPIDQQRLPENASDRRNNPQHKTPDEVLFALKDELQYCHTVDEVNATTDTYRAAIGSLTPPDISAANEIRKMRIAQIEATERAKS